MNTSIQTDPLENGVRARACDRAAGQMCGGAGGGRNTSSQVSLTLTLTSGGGGGGTGTGGMEPTGSRTGPLKVEERRNPLRSPTITVG